ncbi:diaminopimelate epimerase [bacterium]|nr:diaminopimelate epimerase [bacterium]
MLVKTHLISGAGNTFHVVYDENNKFSSELWPVSKKKQLAKAACSKNKSDGFIFLEKVNSENFFKWYFYNNDGSEAEMCGNATRCVGYYIKNILNNHGAEWTLATIAGPIKIQFIENEKFKITMTPPVILNSSFGFFCDTGVPHLVLETDKIKMDQTTKVESRKLREHPEFQPRGTNVTYVAIEGDTTKVKAVSYERGVEDFTDACGTGAMAAALYNLTKRGVKQTQVEMPGGSLIMDLSDLSKPTMTGPAVLLGSFEYDIT